MPPYMLSQHSLDQGGVASTMMATNSQAESVGHKRTYVSWECYTKLSAGSASLSRQGGGQLAWYRGEIFQQLKILSQDNLTR